MQQKIMAFLIAAVIGLVPSPQRMVQAQTATAPALNLTSPEATVRAFIDALSTYDDKRMEECVFQANRRNRGPLLKQVEWNRKSNYKVTITDIFVEKQYERYAFAKIDYRADWVNITDGNKVSYGATDLVKLVNLGPPANPHWLLLSIDPKLMWSPAQGGEIQMAITPIAHPEVEEPPAKCIQNIEMVGYAIMGIGVQSNGKLGIKNKAATVTAPDRAEWSALKRALSTLDDPKNNYIPSARLRCPADADSKIEAYSWNDKLEDVEMAKLTEPANTVLAYEGKDGKFNFRHDARVAVFFADGHSELISEEQAKTLRWTP